MLGSRVDVCMSAGRALGGAQHAELQAMVRGEEIQGSQVRKDVCSMRKSLRYGVELRY